MKKFVTLITLPFLLTACAKTTPVSETIAETAISATTTLEKTLPAECATGIILAQTASIKAQIKAISDSCKAEKDIITKEKLRWQWSFWGLLAVVIAFVIRKILR